MYNVLHTTYNFKFCKIKENINTEHAQELLDKHNLHLCYDKRPPTHKMSVPFVHKKRVLVSVQANQNTNVMSKWEVSSGLSDYISQ